jgi:hypothetical protein
MLTNDLSFRASHDDSSALINANPQQLWVTADHRQQVRLTTSLSKMLINRNAGKERKSSFVAFCHHDGVTQRMAPDKKLTLNRCSRGTSSDNATATKHVVK